MMNQEVLMNPSFGIVPCLVGAALSGAGHPSQPTPKPKPAASVPSLAVALAYSDRTGLWVRKAGTTLAERWAAPKGLVDSRLSPDGSMLAVTLDTSQAKGPVQRAIAVLEGKGVKALPVKGIPGDNNFGPLWSPDGKWILFQHFTGKEWRPAIVHPDGSGFRQFDSAQGTSSFLDCAWWAKDSASFFAYDFEHLIQFSLDGKELGRRAVQEFLGDVELESGYDFSLSPDGKFLLYSASKEVPDIRTEEGPPRLVFLKDLIQGTVTRLSPKGMEAWRPTWLPDGRSFVFVTAKGRKQSIYRGSVAGEPPALLQADASDPSLSH